MNNDISWEIIVGGKQEIHNNKYPNNNTKPNKSEYTTEIIKYKNVPIIKYLVTAKKNRTN